MALQAIECDETSYLLSCFNCEIKYRLYVDNCYDKATSIQQGITTLAGITTILSFFGVDDISSITDLF
jgi:hypothetical protein